jgi:hypothetical protein
MDAEATDDTTRARGEKESNKRVYSHPWRKPHDSAPWKNASFNMELYDSSDLLL